MYPPLFMRLMSLDADTFFRSLLCQRRRNHPWKGWCPLSSKKWSCLIS